MKDTMLSRLLGSLGAPVAQASEAAVAIQAEFDAFRAQAIAEKNELAAALETAVAAVAHADAKVAEIASELNDLKEAAVQAAADAETKRLSARKEKIVAAVGTDKADALMASTEALSDEQFDVVVGAMAGAQHAESKSKMFTEQGAAVEADATVGAAESTEMKLLREKYQGK